MNPSLGKDWMEEQNSLLEGAGNLDLRTVTNVADELQTQAGSLPKLENILLETASESGQRKADAVFTGMKKVVGQTSAILREKMNWKRTGYTPGREVHTETWPTQPCPNGDEWFDD